MVASPSTVTRVSSSGWLARLAGGVLRHRRLVIVCWLVLLVVGGFGAGRVSNRLTFDFALPGQSGYETAHRIEQLYGNGGEQAPSILVVSVPQGQTVDRDQARIATAIERLRRQQLRLRVVDYSATKDTRFVTRDGRSTWAFVFAPKARGFGSTNYSKLAKRVLAQDLPAGYQVEATGLQELANNTSANGPGIFAETMLGALGALAVLAFVFASFLALIPLLVAAFSILTTFLIVLGLSYLANISAIVEFLIALVGLGVAIDYSLLIVTRWREERANGRSNQDAVVAAVSTAGRAVLLSGVTVGIGLVALIVLPVPAMRSIGFGGMLIPLVSVAVSLTLLPATLAGIGARIDWPRLRHEGHPSRTWTRWADLVVRHKLVAAALGIAVLVTLAVPVFSITTGQTGVGALAKSGSAVSAYDRLVAGGVPAGVLTPLEVLTRANAATEAKAKLAGVPGISDTVVSTAPDSNRAGTSVLLGIPAQPTANSKTLTPVKTASADLREVPGVLGVAGVGAISVAYADAVFGNFPLMFAFIAVLTFILLATIVRALLLPALVALLGRWNWWMPALPARVLRVEPSPRLAPTARRTSTRPRPRPS